MTRSRLRFGDALGVGTLGLRSRKTRTTLTALGISIGIAAMVAVLGITASSDAQLQAELDALGPDLIQVRPGESLTGDDVVFPADTAAMIERIGPIDTAAAVTSVGTSVRRTRHIPSGQTGGIAVLTVDLHVLDVVDGTVADGEFLDESTSRLPTVVLGSVAAERLGIRPGQGPRQVFLTDIYFTVIGVLDPIPLAPNLDRAAIIGRPIAEDRFETAEGPAIVYARTHPAVADDPMLFDQVRAVVAATARPQAPDEVTVSRPSDLLSARESTEATFTALLLGLGAVALLVGGVGIANVMVISVIERRAEIGLRRALGATRRHITAQFLVESALLATLGGTAGIGIGAAITVGYAASRDWVISVPVSALGAGIGAALAIGALAGLYPAIRAARVDPAVSIRPAG